MAILIINGDNYATKLTEFEIKYKKCGSGNIELEIDWAAYPSAAWCTITTICKDCHADETIYDI